MKLLKKIISILLAAIFAAATAGSFENKTAFAEHSAGVIQNLQRWSGKEELKENHNYYIDSQVKIAKEEKLIIPKNSVLIIQSGGALLGYFGSKIVVEGSLIIEPSAEAAVSGELIAAVDSKIENRGSFAATKSSVLQLSSTFLNGSSGTTAFSGEVNVYRTGVIENYNRVTFANNSSVTVTGSINCQTDGLMFLKGEFTVTLNGKITLDGKLFVYCNALIGGTLTLCENAEILTSHGAKPIYTKVARIVDNRVKSPAENEKDDKSDSIDYGKSDKVKWLGIDVSRYQGNIDWEKVKAAGVDFAILRSSIGDGADSRSGEDLRFAVNAVEAKNAGVMVGAYHYLWAETVEEAVTEAKYFIKTIAPYELDFPAVLDFEDPSQQNNLTNEERTAIAKAFLEEVEKAGYYPLLYTNRSWATTYLNMDELSKYDVWLAEWFPKPSYTGSYDIWQFTAYGKVAGIAGDVDLNVCTKNYPKIIRENGYKTGG